MHNLLKYQNINMSDSPVVIHDDESRNSVKQVIENTLGSADESLSAEPNESNSEIPSETIEQLRKIEDDAKINAQQIEEDARKYSEHIISQAYDEIERAKIQGQRELNQQIEEIKRDAMERAKIESKQAVLQNIVSIGESLKANLRELEKNQQSFFMSLEKTIPQFALEIAGKILFKKVTSTPEEMDMLIKNTIAGIKGATWIDIKVGEGLKDVAKSIMDEMAENLKDRGTTLDVQTVKENNWEIVAESDKGIIDSSINTQIQNLMELIETYQKKQGE
ncbi:MAG: hypothetical protein RR048_01015 [Oscillospiraceae bacterium]